jgi:hypothetical protein
MVLGPSGPSGTMSQMQYLAVPKVVAEPYAAAQGWLLSLLESCTDAS